MEKGEFHFNLKVKMKEENVRKMKLKKKWR